MEQPSFLQETKGQQKAINWQKQIFRNWEQRLESTESIQNYNCVKNNINSTSSLFKKNLSHRWEHSTFLKTPLIKDLSRLKDYDLAVFGVPYASISNHKSKTNFGPQGIRRISASYKTHNWEIGTDLKQKIAIGDLGDLNLLPEEKEQSFERISQGVAQIFKTGIFPIILGGDRAISYPIITGINGSLNNQKIGIIQFDRQLLSHSFNSTEKGFNSSYFRTHQLTNILPKNIVQLGVSDRQNSKQTCLSTSNIEKNTLTVREIAKIGLDAAVDFALKRALDGTDRIYLCFDISCIDTNSSTDTGSLFPREALYLLGKIVKNANICGLQVTGVSPPNEIGNIEAMMATRIICSAIANLIISEQLPRLKGNRE